MKKLLFVFNPRSGKGLIKNHLLAIVETFSKAGYEILIHPTKRPLDAKEIVMKKQGKTDLIVCCGGDGTISEVVSGIIETGSKVPVGYIPAGSTNDFANSLRLPKKMENAAEVAVSGQIRAIDMGKFNGRTFVYVAAFGAFTEVSYATSQNLKNVLGHQAYILEGFKKMSSIRAIPMKITVGDEVIEDSFIYGMVSNAKSVGGMKGITGKHVHLDDGVFEVTLVKKIRNPLDLNAILSVLVGIMKQSERIVRLKGSNITFESQKPVPWTLDGEYGGTQEFVEVENQKQIVNLVVGKMEKKSEG